MGYFIVFNDGLAKSNFSNLITEFDRSASNNLGLSISPRVFQIYFGLCFVAAASALYAWGCPRIVKNYSSAGDYIAGEGTHFGELALRSMEISLAKTDSEFDRFRKQMSDRISQDFSIQEAQAEVKNATLHKYFDNKNQSTPNLRLIITILYGIGIAILALPATKIFYQVCTVLYRLLTERGVSAIW